VSERGQSKTGRGSSIGHILRIGDSGIHCHCVGVSTGDTHSDRRRKPVDTIREVSSDLEGEIPHVGV